MSSADQSFKRTMVLREDERTTLEYPLEIIPCDTFVRRFRGAMFERAIRDDQVYWLPGVRMIHTMFMAEPISLLFYGDDGLVTGLRETVRPYRMVRGPAVSRGVFEWPAGRLDPSNVRPNETRIAWKSESGSSVSDHYKLPGSFL